MADVFEVRESHAQCDELQAWREDLFDLITETESLCWLLLTKRPQNILNTMRWWARQGGMEMVEGLLKRVWVGTSVENQAVADERIAHLLDVPAGVRFLSVEPLLGAVDLELYLHGIDWVIVGGESGHNARPMHPDWVRAIRDQCIAAGVPFFFKQWGEWLPLQTADEASQYGTSKMVEAENMRWSKVGKHAAGRMLDGREWNEYPRPST
jgi:protein gp37